MLSSVCKRFQDSFRLRARMTKLNSVCVCVCVCVSERALDWVATFKLLIQAEVSSKLN